MFGIIATSIISRTKNHRFSAASVFKEAHDENDSNYPDHHFIGRGDLLVMDRQRAVSSLCDAGGIGLSILDHMGRIRKKLEKRGWLSRAGDFPDIRRIRHFVADTVVRSRHLWFYSHKFNIMNKCDAAISHTIRRSVKFKILNG